MPQQNPNESAEETTGMCLKLFAAIGTDVSINDVDIAHRVLVRMQSNRSKAIICKFVRRLAEENVIAARKQTSNVQPEQLYLPSATKLDSLQIYQHLTSRLQELLFEANKSLRMSIVFNPIEHSALAMDCLTMSNVDPDLNVQALFPPTS
ncbi:Hypothetical predicted protein, partial [Paramuricea clavata]